MVGGLIPLLPYMMASGPGTALAASAALTAAALAGFGWLKARANGLAPLGGALQALAIGGLAAVAAAIVAGAAGG